MVKKEKLKTNYPIEKLEIIWALKDRGTFSLLKIIKIICPYLLRNDFCPSIVQRISMEGERNVFEGNSYV